MRSGIDTAQALTPEQRAKAIEFRRMLWRQIKVEDQRLELLVRYCTLEFCNGDRRAGRRLASDLLWAVAP